MSHADDKLNYCLHHIITGTQIGSEQEDTMAVSDQYFDPQLRAHTLAADLVACADALSSLAGHLIGEIEDTDPATASGMDARLLSTWAALSNERNKLRRLASDVRSLAAVIR